jgi:hypothetical protein
MATAPAFNATDWLKKNAIGGVDLSAEASASVASFTTMWNLFEGVLCDNHATVSEFERIAQDLGRGPMDLRSTDELDLCLSFWTFRYRTPEGFSNRFAGLSFRRNDRREHVEQVLLGELQTPQEKVLALLIIVYRLRNNLFHGLKTIATLNDQIPNLEMACRCLAAVFELSRSHLVIHRQPQVARR